MNFSRKKKRGQVQKHHKTWLSDCGQYKVDWRNESYGVRIRPVYHATVLCIRNLGDPHKQWDFAGRRSFYKTLEAAQQACEHHHKSWLEAITISEGERAGRADRLRSLEFRSRLKVVRKKGKTRTILYQRIMCSVPIWVTKRANRILIEHFFMPPRRRPVDNECDENDPIAQSDPTETSPSLSSESATPSTGTSTGPVSRAKAVAKSSIQSTSQATSLAPSTSSAPPAKEAGKGLGKRAPKNIEPKSKAGGRKPKRSTARKRSAKAA